MDKIESLITAAQSGDMNAYALIVRQFQDMVYGYSYTLLGDFHLAEDAAQEAFVEAYYNLPKLQERKAFSGWLRQIVHHRCNRLLRGKTMTTLSLDESQGLYSKDIDPYQTVEKHEQHDIIKHVLQSLSQPLREVTTLFYINGYTHQEVSDFLEIPVNTVKSRLHASRKHLKERMIGMVKQELDHHGLPADFARKVIEDVPKVGFYQGGNNCPESYTFPSCLGACLKFLGRDLGRREIEIHGAKWYLNNNYVFIMGTSGEAFRLFWKPGWRLDNVNSLGDKSDPGEFIDRAFEAVGYKYQIVYKNPDDANHESLFKKAILENIQQKEHPVIGLGIIGPPECCVITGYDEKGDVLVGWNFFQGMPEHNQGIDFEPSGYFRKRNWYQDTWGLILIGEQTIPAPMPEIYRKSMQWAIDLAQRPTINLGGERQNGLAAYTAWSEALLQDDEFPSDNMDILRQRHMAHDNAAGMVAEGRWYGAQYLKMVVEDEPALAEDLNAALACYEAEHSLIWQIWGLVGGIGRSDEHVKNFADPAIRRQIAPLILQARAQEEKATQHLQHALKKKL
ncbi:MAG: sigma-70 family RNA polymerase sigma factor [Sedimentisphaerales bacterium]|nr:sigma-70 family RNA polymerase sigma factor [Sedimentisphaerales bacterium]